jgi:purine-binding chemotaxis protein CheW
VTADGADRTHAVAEVPDPVPAPIRSCLFRLGGEIVAVALRTAREFVRMDHVTAVPRAGPQFLGVISLRGRIVPVVDLRPLLGLSPEATLGRGCHALVVQAGAADLAIAVEEILGLESLADGPDDEPLRTTRFGARCVRPDGAAVSLLDVGSIAEALRARPAVTAKEDPL